MVKDSLSPLKCTLVLFTLAAFVVADSAMGVEFPLLAETRVGAINYFV